MILTNKDKMSLSVAVWLASDSYDYNNDPSHFSATQIMKPIRELILTPRVPQNEIEFDIAERIPSAMGTALHDGIYESWMNQGYVRALQRLGFPEKIIARIVVNPQEGQPLPEDAIIVYQEQRLTRKLGKWTISGKPDFIGDGMLEDFKSTGVYGYLKGNNDEKYRIQGSIYKWLDPDLIISNYIVIQFIFTDWQKIRAMTEARYPSSRILPHRVTLWPVEKTERFLTKKLELYEQLYNAVDADIPLCTQQELWQDNPVYKYFKNPAGKRATKNYDEYHEADAHYIKDGSIGVIKEIKGMAKKCLYCSAFPVCQQKDQLILDGLLEINE